MELVHLVAFTIGIYFVGFHALLKHGIVVVVICIVVKVYLLSRRKILDL